VHAAPEDSMRNHVVAAALASAVALGPAAAQEGTLKKVKDSGVISLGHRESSIPFSYYDDKQQVVGYSHDLMMLAVEAVKGELKLAKLDVKLTPVTSQNRIPLVQNGTVDLECGSTTNNLERQKQVAFTITHFVTANRFVTKRSAKIGKLADLKGKTVVSTAGTTNIKQITEINNRDNLGMNIISANGHPEAFQMVETGRAAAFVMDDILLYGLVAQSRRPKDYVISAEALSVEPYGIMLRKDDPEFKKVVDAAMVQTYKSGAVNGLYQKWFMKPIPPRNINLNVPMSAQLKKVVSNPTDSGDPADYK
jgi:glutamate/aspartate transport system substrate-binding protein